MKKSKGTYLFNIWDGKEVFLSAELEYRLTNAINAKKTKKRDKILSETGEALLWGATTP